MKVYSRWLLVGACLCAVASVPATVGAQSLDGAGVVPTGLRLRGLDGVKRVLMIAAHPDDEDSRLLTALSRGMGVETAYLALTRGDGGQNLIGPELWEGLGLIRTGELEAARKVDGGRQFFTRAFDFGYSKRADEALTFWPREELLRDVVWVIREFRPQVVITVFSGTPADGHGQHQAAGIMAREAFDAAGDSTRFSDQFRYGVTPWAPMKLYQSVWRRPDLATTSLDIGRVDPLLGRSLFQLSMESRSQHRSQDMGAPLPMGPRRAGAMFVRGRNGAGEGGGFFQGVDTSLVDFARDLPAPVGEQVADHLKAYRAALDVARREFGLELDGTAAALLEALDHLDTAASLAAGRQEARELQAALARRLRAATEGYMGAAGIIADVRAADDLITPGQTVEVTASLWNGGRTLVRNAAVELALPDGWEVIRTTVQRVDPDVGVPPNSMGTWSFQVKVPEDAPPSVSYYLRQPRDGYMYRWPPDPELWGLPRDPPLVFAEVRFDAGAPGESVSLETSVPWRYVGVDQAKGEFSKPVLVVPRLSVAVSPSSIAWPAHRTEGRTFTVALQCSAPEGMHGVVRLEGGPGWRVTPAQRSFDFSGPGVERTVSFTVEAAGPMRTGHHTFQAVAESSDGTTYRATTSVIDYEHIQRSIMVDSAHARVTVVDARVRPGLRVGYIMGTGDDGPDAIRQLGAEVTLLTPEQIREGAFDGFDVLVLGVRAYEARSDVRTANAQILDFARRGGTVIVQYNQYQFARGGYAPYPLTMDRPAARVADEAAPVTILDPDSPVFTVPNRVTTDDFAGWVQERGLYFPAEWDEHYVPLLEMHDPGEPPRRGALLAARVGEGVYVYTGLSFFRQWAAGVPGAYRLFANLISLRAEDL